MKSFLKTFYGKLSLIFLFLLILLGSAQIFITIQSSMRFMSETDQKLNLPLAQNMAAELRPFLKDSLSLPVIEDKIHYMMVMNPKVEIYLLNSHGKILAFFADPKKKLKKEFIDLDPVRKFFRSSQNELILGDDPRYPGKQKPFSVAPLSIGKDLDGFLYIILGGEQYESAAGMLRESFIIKTTIIGLMLSILVTGFVGLSLFFFLTRRLRSMRDVVRCFEQGDLALRIASPSADEIGQLGQSFNVMADTIARNMEELKQTDLLRRELIANVSHDLRSPLASIQGYMETVLMKADQLDPKEREKYLNIILNNTVMLSQLVEELFELSKLDARQVESKLETFSIAELMQDVVLKYRPQAEQAGVHLESIVPSKSIVVSADIGLIERAVSNLIENAIKYTPDKGVVKVALTEGSGKVHISISDTGSGISEQDLPHVFERCYRGGKNQTRKPGGSGLGLAISKKIIELHDSDLLVESQLNVGTRFSFDLKRETS
ncbi:MAG: HAMP domain-containing protein [Calditrichae bacterium]|nr:HAMP domain-containing protein [Calditrichia bacterium]